MKELIFIVWTRGWQLKAKVENGELIAISGNTCPRGKTYALNELTNPTRMITSTVAIDSAELKRLPVMTDNPFPKELIFDAMKEINKVKVKSPIKITRK